MSVLPPAHAHAEVRKSNCTQGSSLILPTLGRVIMCYNNNNNQASAACLDAPVSLSVKHRSRFLTDIKVYDLKALLFGKLQHHLNVVCVGNAQRVSSQ